jgi:hypothetical protein
MDGEIPFSTASLDSPGFTTSLASSDLESQSASRVEKPDKVAAGDPGKAKSTPPSVGEWQDFIGRIVLRTVLDAYVTWMLKDVELTEREEAYIHLSKDDLKEIAAPFASFANKQPYLRKHGRTIIAAADSWEAIVTLMIWMRRVNKIARRHAPERKAAAQAKQAARQQSQQTHRHSEVRDQNVIQMQERQAQNNGSQGPATADGEQPGNRPAAPPVGGVGGYAFHNPGTG